MKSLLIAGSALFLSLVCCGAANISSAGVDGEDGGLLKVDQADPYWWFCAQPDASRGPLPAGPAGYTADVVSLDYGWTRQTTERFAFAESATQERKDDLVTQVNVIEFVLDEYLPWETTSGRFLEHVANPVGDTDQAANVDFFNRFYAIHEYVKALHGKLYEAVFEDLSVFNPLNPFGTLTEADEARRDYFDAIKSQINALAASPTFSFDGYEPTHAYWMVNTFEDQANDEATWEGKPDYQDAIIIGGAVPEPSTGLLTLGSVLLLGNRRRRRS